MLKYRSIASKCTLGNGLQCGGYSTLLSLDNIIVYLVQPFFAQDGKYLYQPAYHP